MKIEIWKYDLKEGYEIIHYGKSIRYLSKNAFINYLKRLIKRLEKKEKELK